MKLSKTVLLIIYGSLLALLWLFIPHNENWTPTYHPEDKLPYGCAHLHKAIQPKAVISTHNQIPDSLTTLASKFNSTILLITPSFNPSAHEMNKLLNFVKNGGNIVLSASSANATAEDSLNLNWNFNVATFSDSVRVCQWANNKFSNCWHDVMPKLPLSHLELKAGDSSNHEVLINMLSYDTLMLQDNDNRLFALKINLGRGQLLVHSLPVVFSNFGLTHGSKSQVDYLLNLLGNGRFMQDLFFTERALGEMADANLSGSHFARVEKSPMYEVLKHDLLRYTYYFLMAGVLLFFIFSIKRKQRAIPVWQPPGNESMEFIKMLASVYLSARDNSQLLDKKIKWLNTFIFYRYGIRDFDWSPHAIHALSLMADFDLEKLERISRFALQSKALATVSDGYLKAANQMINEFVYNTNRVS